MRDRGAGHDQGAAYYGRYDDQHDEEAVQGPEAAREPAGARDGYHGDDGVGDVDQRRLQGGESERDDD